MERGCKTVLIVEKDSKRADMYFSTMANENGRHKINRRDARTVKEGLEILALYQVDIVVYAGSRMNYCDGKRVLEEAKQQN